MKHPHSFFLSDHNCSGLQKLEARLAKTAFFGSHYWPIKTRFGSHYWQMDSHYLQTAHIIGQNCLAVTNTAIWHDGVVKTNLNQVSSTTYLLQRNTNLEHLLSHIGRSTWR